MHCHTNDPHPACATRRLSRVVIVLTLSAAILITVSPAAALTDLSMLCVSPDITAALGSGPSRSSANSFPSGTTTMSFAGIPAGVVVTAYFPLKCDADNEPCGADPDRDGDR
jgi:Na+/proline symporter